jgi:hypothetical protein
MHYLTIRLERENFKTKNLRAETNVIYSGKFEVLAVALLKIKLQEEVTLFRSVNRYLHRGFEGL